MGVTILSDDPGSKNYGRAVIRAFTKKGIPHYRLIYAGLVEYPVDDLKGDCFDVLKFQNKELRKFLKTVDPIDCYVAERFMSRGRMGATGEYVSFMLCANISLLKKPSRLLSAASWKNAFNRNLLKHKTLKKFDLKQIYKWCKFPTHVFDATLIGMYQGAMLLGLVPFSHLESKKDVESLIKRINRCYVN